MEMRTFTEEQIIAFLEGNLSSEKQQQLEDWLNASWENRLWFDELKKVHETTGKLDFHFQADEAKALVRVQDRIRKRRVLRLVQYGAAAVLLLFFSLEIGIGISSGSQWIELDALSRQVVYLPDSTKVIMDGHAHLKYPKVFNRSKRTVFLRGQAYFQVTHDASHPFVVKTPNARIQVLGTQFLVDASRSESEKVTVDEGLVAFSPLKTNSEEAVLLKARECGEWQAENQKIRKYVNEQENSTAWLSGVLLFRDRPLSGVIADLQTFYSIKIRLAQDELSDLKLSGRITRETLPGEAMDIVCAITGLLYEKQGEVYVLRK